MIDFATLANVTVVLAQGMGVAIEIFLLTLLFSLPLGLLVAFGSMSKCAPVRWLFNAVVWVIRGTPLMLQLMIIFFVPGLLDHNIWGQMGNGRVAATVVAFTINYACLFLRDLSRRHPGRPRGPAGSGRGAGHDKATDLL